MASGDGGALGVGVVVLAGIAAAAGYFGLFGQTGSNYFTSCWELKAAAIKDGSKREAKSPQQAVDWAACEPTTRRTVYGLGFVFAPNPQDDVDRALERACPSAYREVPIGGLYMLTVSLIEEAGGPRFLDRFLPAKLLIEKVWTDRWPNCSSERERYGISKVIERTPGKFEWERPCAKCT
jgi:hypothetical protein